MDNSNDKLQKMIDDAYAVVKQANITEPELRAEAFKTAINYLWREELGMNVKDV